MFKCGNDNNLKIDNFQMKKNPLNSRAELAHEHTKIILTRSGTTLKNASKLRVGNAACV